MAVPYGDFLAEGPLPGAGSPNVLEARQRGATGPLAAVVKRFPVNLDQGPSETDRALAVKLRMAVILLQDRAVQDGALHVAPILELGTRGLEAWYVTQRYEQSLATYLTSLKGRPAPGRLIWQILLGVTRGALALSLTDAKELGARRAHGNLKLSNVLLNGVTATSVREVALTDPAAQMGQTGEFEQADLSAIGRMLGQLILGQVVPDSEDLAALLRQPGRAWRKAFGPRADAWRKLALGLASGTGELATLKALEEHLISWEPAQQGRGWKVAMVASLMAAILAGVGIFVRPTNRERLTVRSYPPGGWVSINGHRVGMTPFETNLPAGALRLEVEFTNEFMRLPRQTNQIALQRGVPAEVDFSFPFARFSFKSKQLRTSAIEVGWQRGATTPDPLGTAPLSVPLPPGINVFTYAQSGFKTALATNISVTGTTNILEIDLVEMRAGEVEITFESGIPGGQFIYNGINRKYQDLPESSQVPVEVVFPPPWRAFTTNLATGMTNRAVPINPPHGWLRLESSAETPGEAELLVKTGDTWVGFGRLEEQESEGFAWPPGDFEVQVQHYGFNTNTLPVKIVAGTNITLSVALKAMFGFLDATANLDGVRLFNSTNGIEVPLGTDFLMVKTTNRVPLFPNVPAQLIARYQSGQGILDPVRHQILVKPGATMATNFEFSFATLLLAPEPTNALIYSKEGPLTNLLHYLRPNAEYTFTARADHYDDLTANITLASREKVTRSLRLEPRLYPVQTEVSPREAQLTLVGSGEPWPAGRTNIRWGTNVLRLTHPALGVTDRPLVTQSSGIATQSWRLPHARVNVVTPRQPGLRIKLDGQEIPNRRSPLTNYLLKPGLHSWAFALGDFSGPLAKEYPPIDLADEDSPQELPFDAQFLQPVYTNSLGMRFVLFPERELYWAECETTRGEFDLGVRPENSAGTDTNWPAVTHSDSRPEVSFRTALSFRDWINSQPLEAVALRDLPGGPWEYDLPNQEEWPPYEGKGTPEYGNFGDNLLPARGPRGPGQTYRGGPEPGIQDIYGNAMELVRGPNNTAAIVGGAAGNTSVSAEPWPDLARGDEFLGFRLVVRRKASP